MKKTVKNLLAAVVVTVILVGAVIANHSYKINNAPQVEVGALGAHCGEWVLVSGIVKQVFDTQSYVITDMVSFSETVRMPQALVVATKEQLARRRAPSNGDNVQVRGLAMCEDGISSAKGIRISENDLKNFTELQRANTR